MESTHAPQPDKIRKMFSAVAGRYDRANSILSMGVHHLWRKKLVSYSDVSGGQRVLDCATGTGDLALEFKKAVGPKGYVMGIDFCKEMLHMAPAKAKKLELKVDFKQADVTQLPFETGEFDLSSIAFGIRNVHDPALGLKEMARVTKPGGHVMVLEFGQVTWPGFSHLYRLYSEKILPTIGGFVTGEHEAYHYLQSSSANFPSGNQFLELMNSTEAFSKTEYESLTGGIAYMYKGTVK